MSLLLQSFCITPKYFRENISRCRDSKTTFGEAITNLHEINTIFKKINSKIMYIFKI